MRMTSAFVGLFLLVGYPGAICGDELADSSESKTPLYQERLRPQFHFTARQWTISKLNPEI